MYARGVDYPVMETTIEHMFTTYLISHGIERMPEAYWPPLPPKAPCVCMSATWSAPTVKNFNLEYLDEVHGVVRKDVWIDELNQEIVRQTSCLTSRLRRNTTPILPGWMSPRGNCRHGRAGRRRSWRHHRVARRGVRARDAVL